MNRRIHLLMPLQDQHINKSTSKHVILNKSHSLNTNDL